MKLFIGANGELFGVAWDGQGRAALSQREGAELGLPELAVQPQVGPLARPERLRERETVERGEGTYLAPQHFRNQLYLDPAATARFRRMAEATWPGLQVKDLLLSKDKRPEFELLVRDENFVGEASLMGHGLQMWLQVIWFLSRTPPHAVVVLDEPDVYMHPDVQRRVFELVRDRYRQLIVATHSVEILADVPPERILSIEKRKPESGFLTSLAAVQQLVTGFGSVHSLQAARLFRSRRFLFVEGEDVSLLRTLQRTCFPKQAAVDLIPHQKLGGRGGWSGGMRQGLPKVNAEGHSIKVFCVLDRDYFPDEEVEERREEARQWGVELTVWSRKELENYLLVPEAVSRVIAAGARKKKPGPNPDEVAEKIDEIVESMKTDPIQDGFAARLHARDKQAGHTHANRRARHIVEERWRTRNGRWGSAPGKAVISALSQWAKEEYGFSFGIDHLARALRSDEIDPEVRGFLRGVVQ